MAIELKQRKTHVRLFRFSIFSPHLSEARDIWPKLAQGAKHVPGLWIQRAGGARCEASRGS